MLSSIASVGFFPESFGIFCRQDATETTASSFLRSITVTVILGVTTATGIEGSATFLSMAETTVHHGQQMLEKM